jgi:hypothetical protein
MPPSWQGIAFKDVKLVDAPMFYASGASVMSTGNDFVVVFTRGRVVENPDGTVNQEVAITEPTVIITTTAQTLKDLYILLSQVIPKYEADYGEIKSAFTRMIDQAATKGE